MRFLLLIFTFYFSLSLIGQNDSIPFQQSENANLIEDYIINLGVEGDFDFNTLFENLEYLSEKPLNINKASRDDLEALYL